MYVRMTRDGKVFCTLCKTRLYEEWVASELRAIHPTSKHCINSEREYVVPTVELKEADEVTNATK